MISSVAISASNDLSQTQDESGAKSQSSGATRRVVRGSMWSVGGQCITLLASIIATPVTIRLLGPEGYGVLALINLIVGYLAFSDWGMGTASTRFGAEAHARNDDNGEAAVIWTCLLISVVPALFAASVMVLVARPLLEDILHVPAHLQSEAVIALRLASIGFIARVAAGVLNTPQIVRLKMHMNAGIMAASSVAQIGLTPIILLLGGGLAGASAVISGVAIVTALGQAFFSQRLLPRLLRPQVDWELVGRVAKFGGAMVVSIVIVLLLTNVEKLFLARFNSVKDLAYYSVAFSLANLLTIPAGSLVQTLLPTFANFQASGKKEELEHLFDNILRGVLLFMPVVTMLICMSAKSFFVLWAGADYGISSTPPFFILMAGLLAQVLTFVPYCLFTALGRADFNARYHMVELVPYLLLAAFLTYRWGIIGAALAWSSRMVIAFPLYIYFVRYHLSLPCAFLADLGRPYLVALLILLLPLLVMLQGDISRPWQIWLSIFSLAGYLCFLYAYLLKNTEREWAKQKLMNLRSGFRQT